MSVSKVSKGLLLGLALLLATSVFAANKGTLQVSDSVTVNGKQLAAGDYTVKWEGAGPNVELNILKGKNVVATVPARMVDLARSPDRDSAVTVVNSDGRKSLNEIRFGGKKYAFAIGEESAKSNAGGSNGYQQFSNLNGRLKGDAQALPFFSFSASALAKKEGAHRAPPDDRRLNDCLQYFGILGSTRSAQARIPPARLCTFLKPA